MLRAARHNDPIDAEGCRTDKHVDGNYISGDRMKYSTKQRSSPVLRAAIFSLVVALGQTGLGESVPATAAGNVPPAIVVGFVGGFVKRDNLAHSEVQLAARLRKAYLVGVDVETFENHRAGEARKKVLDLLDTNHDGVLTADEKEHARIIIYGHSWGGSEAVALARELGERGIPVLLTIQVDSISRSHQNDAVIPANVARAANFYQPKGRLHGQPEIRAADPTRTSIIGNFRFDYKTTSYHCPGYPWYDRIFAKAHTQIECDPRVWKQAEALIRSDLPPATETVPTQ